MLVLHLLLWVSVFVVVYTYLLYPFLLSIWAKGKQNNQQIFGKEEDLPYLILLMSVHNEEAVIERKLQSIYHTDYPTDNFDIIIGSDGSTDRTNEIVARYAERCDNLTLQIFEQQCGKPTVLNSLMERHGKAICSIDNCLIVMTDANVLFTENTLYELAKHFKNSSIGIVGSNVLNVGTLDRGIAIQEQAYIQRENSIKYHEGVLWGSMMGAFGACYAIRADLFTPIPANFLVDDFFLTMHVLQQGKKAICEPAALCYEDVSEHPAIEFKRKRRISAGNFQNLRRFIPLLLAPTAKSFCFWSHKVLRWVAPFFILIALFCNYFLANHSVFYHYLFYIQIALLCTPLIDYVLSKMGIHLKAMRYMAYFYLMNAALLAGFFHYLSGVKNSTWQRTHRNT